MRVVVYDYEEFEPITVVNVPLAEKDISERRYWRVPVPESLLPMRFDTGVPGLAEIRIVILTFEPFVRRHPTTGLTQYRWVCFTRQEEWAMLLKPDWLPGQRATLQDMEKYTMFLEKLMFAGMRQ